MDSLRAWLPDVQPGADHADRRHPLGRYLTRELFGSPGLKRLITRSAGCSRTWRRTLERSGGADDHHKPLIGPDQGDRRPRNHRASGATDTLRRAESSLTIEPT